MQSGQERDLSTLELILRGLTLDPEITATTGRSWALNPGARVLLVPPDELAHRPAQESLGIVAHEAAHDLISRTHLLKPAVPFPLDRARWLLLNALEDTRVNRWLIRRWPGAAGWLTRALTQSARELNEELPKLPGLPRFQRFLAGIVLEPLQAWSPAAFPAAVCSHAVQAALETTRADRQRVAEDAELAPAVEIATRLEPAVTATFRQEVLPRLCVRGETFAWRGWEQQVLIAAVRSLSFSEQQILPVAARLLEADLAERQCDLAEQDLQELQDALQQRDLDQLRRALGDGEEASRPGGTDRETPDQEPRRQRRRRRQSKRSRLRCSRQLLEQILDTLLGSMASDHGWGGTPGEEEEEALDGTCHLLGDHDERRVPDAATAQALVEPQLAGMARSLEELLTPTRLFGRRGGHPSGQTADLRRVMRLEHDLAESNRLRTRRAVPHRNGAAFLLLVDLSGSMRGSKSLAALAGTLLFAETLSSLAIPCAIRGFQDQLIPVLDFDQDLTPARRRAIHEMVEEIHDERPQGRNQSRYNDDGPCLLEAASLLESYPAHQRFLVVVSDGHPEGKRSKPSDLHAAVARIRSRTTISLVALGLGKGTGHVAQYYPESIADVPIEQFATQIARLLERLVQRSR